MKYFQLNPVRLFGALLLFIFLNASQAFALNFDLVTAKKKVTIVYDAEECKLNSIIANLLAADIALVTGYKPVITTSLTNKSTNVILIGSIASKLIKAQGSQLAGLLSGKWECYGFQVKQAANGHNNVLLIAGSDFRGTAYGVFELSARIGVSPWAWWADATPIKKKSLSLNIDRYVSAEPSVKYRGIFINDEDWGLQPWAAKTFEPETGDIGQKTYRKVFELLLRLKANLIWPAMHPSTKAFYHYPGNVDAAADYQIIVGSSHAEPMLRNNVSEWNEKTMGHFNYLTNQLQVQNYWESRIKESSRMNAIYTVGMRGVHDSGIEGVKTVKETVPLLERIFNDQRNMFKNHINADVAKIPQAFTAYKEVLEVYNAGLKVPDDITLVWPDDNYGYIQRLSDERENKRQGGAGVYYHISYWGRPHDNLWLCTTSPSLIVEEMTKAYRLNANKIWVLNVGDIKPGEYDTQLFLDMAYNIKPFLASSGYTKTHLTKWLGTNIDAAKAPALSDVMTQYYALAFERKPEYMGWSQTEPTTQVKPTAYNHFYYGDQPVQRGMAYGTLADKVKYLKSDIPAARQDAFYQLVYYPVVGAALMNDKWLAYDKANLFAKQGHLVANHYYDASLKAYKSIEAETEYFNTKLSKGKWAGIMDMKPRKLPVFDEPKTRPELVKTNEALSVQPEGTLNNSGALALPTFTQYGQKKYFIDLFLNADSLIKYKLETSATWIKLSETSGTLLYNLSGYARIFVSVDWNKIPKTTSNTATINVLAAGKTYPITVTCNKLTLPASFKGFVENNGFLSIHAKNFQNNKSTPHGNWQLIDGLGTTGQSVQAGPIQAKPTLTGNVSESVIKSLPKLTYNFYNYTQATARINLYTLPTFALNNDFGVRYAVSVDNGPIEILNFKTVGRSEEWKQTVLSNSIMRSVTTAVLAPGTHQLQVYMIDPGVVLDRMVIDLGGLKPFYGVLPESGRME